MTGRFNIQIGIATAGRRDIIARLLPTLLSQIREPDRVIVAVSSEDDIDRGIFDHLPKTFEILRADRGSCSQRNAIISHAYDADIMLFMDDDFILADDYLGNLEHLFSGAPDIVMATGTVIADGVTGPGIDFDEGLRLVATHAADRPANASASVDIYNGYGCNMAVRMDVVREIDLRFDEALPLYGWLEDVDFSRRLAACGRIVRAADLIGVHLGVKSGRAVGFSLGYSQVANPVYLARKRTMSLRHASVQILRNLAANLTRSLHPEPWVDRRGRLRGNARALADFAAGRLAPVRILEFARKV